MFSCGTHIILIPAIFVKRFSGCAARRSVFDTLCRLKFARIFRIRFATSVVRHRVLERVRLTRSGPIVDSFYPTVIQLVRIHFPTLISGVLLIGPPIGTATACCRGMLRRSNFSSRRVNVFCIAPYTTGVTSLGNTRKCSSAVGNIVGVSALCGGMCRVLGGHPGGCAPRYILPPSLAGGRVH